MIKIILGLTINWRSLKDQNSNLIICRDSGLKFVYILVCIFFSITDLITNKCEIT